MGATWRITVLTSRLLRLEWHPQGQFVDVPTQLVASRDFPAAPFTVHDDGAGLRLITEHLELTYDGAAFSPAGLHIQLRHAAGVPYGAAWNFGDVDSTDLRLGGNLSGTARTLDQADGAIPLEPGLLSKRGFAVVDDSSSVLLTDDGWVQARPEGGVDLYFFGHGRDFAGALSDFFALTGRSPLIPRWALGNWWSRYWAYSAEEYLDLMDRFRATGLPFSVAVIDMDWHVTDIPPELGSGWTGYSWNRELFPDPAGFLSELHRRGLAVTLNVHPADGVRRHEDAYPEVAAALGTKDGDRVPFDIADRDFAAAYFTHLHHPLEDDGVDFWWIDWQQGEHTRIRGLDPLWMLNYLHYRDSARVRADGSRRRPLIFSRYAGLGSHRYPVGFSGDTITTWASLDFQPYFTACAANVGYFWWSHDIGGHMFGVRDHELETRWFQLGVFSPINRLHSTNSAFADKAPWAFPQPHAGVMSRFLRLRHRLVPYLYTAMWRTHTHGVGVVRPLYHEHPTQEAAYQHRNEFFFGPDCLVAPITAPLDDASGLGQVRAWLPEGEWFDLFTSRPYRGGRELLLHRWIEYLPVLVRAGAVLPLALDPAADVARAPRELTLRAFPGVGGCELVEDDGGPDPVPHTVRVGWELTSGRGRMTVTGLVDTRHLVLELVDVADAHVTCDGVELPGAVTGDELLGDAFYVDLGDLGPGDIVVELSDVVRTPEATQADCFALLDAAEVPMQAKEDAWAAMQHLDGPALVAALDALDLPGALGSALLEVVARR